MFILFRGTGKGPVALSRDRKHKAVCMCLEKKCTAECHEEEMVEMARKMYLGMEHLPKEQREWYRLFRLVDADNSGSLSFEELTTMFPHAQRAQQRFHRRHAPLCALRARDASVGKQMRTYMAGMARRDPRGRERC